MLSRLEPKSDNLANACIAVIADKSQRHDWFDAVETAASLLAEQFYEDTSIENRLVALSGPYHIPTDVVMALALGWPNSQLLRALDFDGHSHDMRAGEMYPKYALIAASETPQMIESDLFGVQRQPFLANNVIRPLLARLRRDATLADQLAHSLFVTGSPSVKASFSKLLSFSRGLSVELDKWSRDELARQDALTIPDIGYDLFAKTTQSVRLSALEVLEGPARANAWDESLDS
jgi:hypothetical protein